MVHACCQVQRLHVCQLCKQLMCRLNLACWSVLLSGAYGTGYSCANCCCCWACMHGAVARELMVINTTFPLLLPPHHTGVCSANVRYN
jgi:hypothetical protein